MTTTNSARRRGQGAEQSGYAGVSTHRNQPWSCPVDFGAKTENIKRPALVVHHIEDACWSTRYENAQNFFHGLPNLPRKHFITVSGGDEPKSRRPCKARTQHGFYGVERETVAAIVEWINGKTPPKHVEPRT